MAKPKRLSKKKAWFGTREYTREVYLTEEGKFLVIIPEECFIISGKEDKYSWTGSPEDHPQVEFFEHYAKGTRTGLSSATHEFVQQHENGPTDIVGSKLCVSAISLGQAEEKELKLKLMVDTMIGSVTKKIYCNYTLSGPAGRALYKHMDGVRSVDYNREIAFAKGYGFSVSCCVVNERCHTIVNEEGNAESKVYKYEQLDSEIPSIVSQGSPTDSRMWAADPAPYLYNYTEELERMLSDMCKNMIVLSKNLNDLLDKDSLCKNALEYKPGKLLN